MLEKNHQQEEKAAGLDAVVEMSVHRAAEAAEKGAGIAGAMGLDREQCEAIYAVGHQHYLREKYEDAEMLFAWLARVLLLDTRVLKALGAARKMQKKNEQALEAYALAALSDLQDPEPSFFAAECLFHMGEMKRARLALKAARQQVESLGDHESMMARIDEMLSHIPGAEGEDEEVPSLESLLQEMEKGRQEGAHDG